MPTIQEVADKMGIPKTEAFNLLNSWSDAPGKARLARTLKDGYGWGIGELRARPTEQEVVDRGLRLENLEDFAREFRLEEAELSRVLQVAGVPVNTVARGLIDLSVLVAAWRHLQGGAELNRVELAVRGSAQMRRTIAQQNPEPTGAIDLAWEGGVPTIRITSDMAALLTLSPIAEAVAPAETYRVTIAPAFCGLEAIEVRGSSIEGKWNKMAPNADLSHPLKNISLGACELLSKSALPRNEKKEFAPIAKTKARMHDVILVRIRTAVSDAMRALAVEVMEGRRGYSQVLAESIPVRAHLARYRVGPGRTQTALVLRAAHRRGGPGTKQRTYVLKS